MTISHTVYRNRNNSIVLELLSDDEPLAAPEDIVRVELGINGQVYDTTANAPHLTYDDTNGRLTAILGRIAGIVALADGQYRCKVTGYASGDAEGTAFGVFVISVADWYDTP